MNYIVLTQYVSIMLVSVLTLRYLKWSHLVKSIDGKEPIKVFINQIDKTKSDKYNVLYRYNDRSYNTWIGNEVGECKLYHNYYLYPIKCKSKNGISHKLYSIIYVTDKINGSISLIMFIMVVNTVALILSK